LKKIIIVILFFFFMLIPFYVRAGETKVIVDNLEIDSKSAILLEPKTMTVIYEKNADEKLPPASMTKLMTMLLVCEALENEVITIDQMLTASKYATSMGGTQIYLEENEQMSVENLLKSVALASANDAAVVLAEGIGGTCERFVKMMNDKASEIGLINTFFKNPNGLPEDGHYSCAYDMSIIGAELINKYGDFILKYTSLYEDYVREDLKNKFWLVNTNKLVKHVDGIDGLKTGWTEEAGYCLTCTMNKNGIRMISVVMGAESIEKRTTETLKLLNFGVNNFKLEKLFSKNDVIEEVENFSITPNKFSIVVKEDVYVLINKNESNNFDLNTIINYSEINKDKNVGQIVIKNNGKVIKKIELVVKEEVKKANIFVIMLEVIKEILLV